MNKIETARQWALSRVGNPYLMGGTGKFCTVAYRAARAAQYPGSAARIKANCPRTNGEGATGCRGCRWYDEAAGTGKRAYDCAQLTRWCMDAVGVRLVSGATSQWNRTQWAERGAIDTLPRDRLCLVYRRDGCGKAAKCDAVARQDVGAASGGDAGADGITCQRCSMGHTGIYLGDGTAIHARGHDWGVVRDSLTAYARWTHWGIPRGLYEEADKDETPAEERPEEARTAADRLSAALAAVRKAQQALELAEQNLTEARHAAG